MAFLLGFHVMKKIVMGNQNISCCYYMPYRNDFTLKEELHYEVCKALRGLLPQGKN